MLIPPTPFPRGRSGPAGFPSPQGLPCPPAPARHLMTYLNPPNPLFKGAHQAFVRTRAHGHRFAVLRPASDDALVALRTLLFRYVMQLGQTLTLRGTFAYSMYLLPQRGEQNRLFCLRRCIHVCKCGPSAHVKLFLSCHGGRSGHFAPVVLH